MEKMYIEFNQRFDTIEKDITDIKGDVAGLKGDVGGLKGDVAGLKGDVTGIKGGLKKTNAMIEHEIMPKIEALFDGQIQNSQQLERIEAKVSKHEDIIMRKIK